MNVKLAAQMLSNFIATALEFCEENNIPAFEHSAPTIKFIRIINRVFDVLNSRSLISYSFKKPLCQENAKSVYAQLDADFEYIKTLQCPKSSKLLTETSRKTGFQGFLINIISVKKIVLGNLSI